MTYWAPLRAGMPKLSAAGPERKVTIPSLKLSCAAVGAARPSVVAVTTDNSAAEPRIREKWSMIFSPGLPALEPARFVRADCPGVGSIDGRLGGLWRPVHSPEVAVGEVHPGPRD